MIDTSLIPGTRESGSRTLVRMKLDNWVSDTSLPSVVKV